LEEILIVVGRIPARARRVGDIFGEMASKLYCLNFRINM